MTTVTAANISEMYGKFTELTATFSELIKSKSKTSDITADGLEKHLGTKLDMAKVIVSCYNTLQLGSAVLDVIRNMGLERRARNTTLEAEMNKVHTENDKLMEYSRIFDKIDEHMVDVKTDLIKAVTEAPKLDVTETIKESLPEIVKATVKEAEKPLKKQWSDLFKSVKGDVKVQVAQSFNDSFSSVLKQNQKEIVETTKAQQDEDLIERERRSRNIVLSNVPECQSRDVEVKINDDTERAARLCDIDKSLVIGCFRAGKNRKEDTDNAVNAKPRPLIVTLSTPNLAKELHNYGNGRMIDRDENIWVNPDLIYSERKANFSARNRRRQKLSAMRTENKNNPNTAVFVSENVNNKNV